jgi:hypothetical protein
MELPKSVACAADDYAMPHTLCNIAKNMILLPSLYPSYEVQYVLTSNKHHYGDEKHDA